MIKFYTNQLLSFFSESKLLILSFLVLPILIYSQPQSQTFNSSSTWSVPAGYVANINVQVWGAGGGGGTNAGDRSGGGGGGAFSFRIYTSLAAGTYTVTVGTGGAAGAAGGNSSFSGGSITTTTAAGGAGSGGTGGGAGGASGAPSSGLYTHAGGTGGAGFNNGGGGGGGGSATSIADGSVGTTATNNNGGAGGTGEGAGGQGSDDADASAPIDDALAGTAPGGGGGGKAEAHGTSKAGANGRVIVTVTFYWESTKTMTVIGGGGSAAETGCTSLTSGVISTSVITVPSGSSLKYRIGGNAGEPVCTDNGGTAPFEGNEGIGLFASATSGGTQVYDSRLFVGLGTSNTPPNLLPSGSGCIYNNNAAARYLTIKTIDTAGNVASLPSQDEEVAYIAYEVITGNSGCINLPIQLSSFEVKLKNNIPLIEWTIFTELDNNYFSVERSRDGINYSEIAKAPSKGKSDGLNEYSYADQTAFKGINYYRIKQVDLKGKATIHAPKSILVPVVDIAIYPTVFDHQVTLLLPAPYDKQVKWTLYDQLGHLIKSGSIAQSQPVQQLSLTEVNAGSYFLAVASDIVYTPHKLLKL